MKHILITGGSDGVGKLTAQKLHALGHAVTILGKDATKTLAVAEEVGCKSVVADVADAKTLQQAFEQVGEIDVLINNAAIWTESPIDTVSPGDIENTIAVNTLGTMYATRFVIPNMKQRKTGRIINVISQAGLYGRQNRAVYTASKWALTGFTKSLQEELKPFGIAVDGFYPGAMNTGFFAKAGSVKDRSSALDPAVAADALVYL